MQDAQDFANISQILIFEKEIDNIIYRLDGILRTGSVIGSNDISCKSITIPSTIQVDERVFKILHIEGTAFEGLSSIENIHIACGILSIDALAFVGCSALNSVFIPKTIKRIHEWAFLMCPSLSSIVVEQGNSVYDSRNNCNAIIETNTNKLVIGCSKTIIPKTVVTIGDDAFSQCKFLSPFVIPKNIVHLGEHAFDGCQFTSVILSNSITKIEKDVFRECEIQSIQIPVGMKEYYCKLGLDPYREIIQEIEKLNIFKKIIMNTKNIMYWSVAIFFIVAAVCISVLTYNFTQKVRVTCGIKEHVKASVFVEKGDVDKMADLFGETIWAAEEGQDRYYSIKKKHKE